MSFIYEAIDQAKKKKKDTSEFWLCEKKILIIYLANSLFTTTS
jgi:hypothetical protein